MLMLMLLCIFYKIGILHTAPISIIMVSFNFDDFYSHRQRGILKENFFLQHAGL
jgi:hypothetical protein